MNKTPKLRFKEFSGNWEKAILGDRAYIKGRIGWKNLKQEEYTKKGPYLIAGKHIKNGIIDWDKCDHISIDRYNESPEIALKDDDIIFSKDGSLGNPAIIEDLKSEATINGTMMLVRLDNTFIYPKYFYYILNSRYFEKLINELKSGSSIPHIFQRDIVSFKFPITEIKEQEKIASFFSLIDEKISLQGEKVEALKDYKNGMMQKIFSRELRFKDDEGRDYPEWEEKRIKDIFTVTRGVVIAKTKISDLKNEVNKYPVYSSQTTNSGILGYDSDFDFEGNYLTWTTDGANAGKVFKRSGKFRCTNVCGVLVEKNETKGFANKMIAEILNKQTPKYVSYVGNPKLMNGVMSDIKIQVPRIDEQVKISKVLDYIDLKIEKEQEKLNYLNEYKKGLLQQMFV